MVVLFFSITIVVLFGKGYPFELMTNDKQMKGYIGNNTLKWQRIDRLS